MNDVLTFIMAGGRGERLYALAKDRSKPAVPFGGRYRFLHRRIAKEAPILSFLNFVSNLFL